MSVSRNRVTGDWLRVAGAWHDCDPPHGATAIRTDGEVSSGERAIASGVIVGRLADGTRDTVFEQPTTESEAVTAGAIGEKTVVADAMEALRQSMQQKASDELVGIECHHFGLAVRSIVFPGKANLPVGEREQPAVSDGL